MNSNEYDTRGLWPANKQAIMDEEVAMRVARGRRTLAATVAAEEEDAARVVAHKAKAVDFVGAVVMDEEDAQRETTRASVLAISKALDERDALRAQLAIVTDERDRAWQDVYTLREEVDRTRAAGVEARLERDEARRVVELIYAVTGDLSEDSLNDARATVRACIQEWQAEAKQAQGGGK